MFRKVLMLTTLFSIGSSLGYEETAYGNEYSTQPIDDGTQPLNELRESGEFVPSHSIKLVGGCSSGCGSSQSSYQQTQYVQPSPQILPSTTQYIQPAPQILLPSNPLVQRQQYVQQQPTSSSSTASAGPLAVMRKTKIDYVPVRISGPAEPTNILVDTHSQPVNMIVRSISHGVNLEHQHVSSPGSFKQTESVDEPHRHVHTVRKPVIQEVREIISPIRIIKQEIQPVKEDVQTTVPRDVSAPGLPSLGSNLGSAGSLSNGLPFAGGEPLAGGHLSGPFSSGGFGGKLHGGPLPGTLASSGFALDSSSFGGALKGGLFSPAFGGGLLGLGDHSGLFGSIPSIHHRGKCSLRHGGCKRSHLFSSPY